MELYLNSCSKAAKATSAKTAASSLADEEERCPATMELYLNFCSKKAKAASVKTATSSLADEKMLSRQVNRLQDGHQLAGHPEVTQFQNWLLMDHIPSFKDQERLIRHRYLDMINRELEYRERRAEEQRRQWMDREERRHWDHMRRKLGLRRKIEEEWKAKEMLLLSRIVEDVKREARIEEQRRRNREESDRKKQALLEKKMAYHLQKMQQNGLKREDTGKNTDYRGLEGTHAYTPMKKKKTSEEIKTLYTVTEQKPNKGGHEQTIGVHQSPSGSKNVTRNSSPPTMFQSNVRDNNTMEQKKDGMLTKKPSPTNGKGVLYPSAPETLLSTQTSPTRTFNRTSQTFMGPAKVEDYNISFAPNTSLLNEYYATYALVQHMLYNCTISDKVTSDELNRILQNIMAWVVATVTSILYPAITRYEERLRSQVYHGDAESVLSSESSSFCSTCSEGFTCTSYAAPPPRPFPGSPRTFSVDIALRRPPTPLKPLSAHVERTVVEKTYSAHGGPPVTTTLTYKTATGVYAHTRLRSCKSDSYLLTSFKAGAQKSKDATTETEKGGLEAPQLPKPTARAEIQNLEKIFVNFKCHLKGETELILESVFQEIMSDLTQAVPAISSVTAEVFVDPCEPELDEVPSNVDISSVASDIVENMLEKLQTAVEKKCVEMFVQEDWPVEMAPCFLTIGERLLPPPSGRPLPTAPPAHPREPMCDVAEDMVQTILGKLMALAAGRQNELPHLAAAAKPPCPPRTPGPEGTFLRRADARKAGPEPEAAGFLAREGVQGLISSIFAQSSLVGYIEEAISTILGYVQTELNNERLVASEETVVFLQLLDDIFTQLHQEPVKAEAPRGRRPRPRPPAHAEEEYRLAGTTIASGTEPRRPLPPINVPGMVLYSDEDSEEIDRLVENALDSSLRSEKGKSQDWGPECWFSERSTCFDRSSKPPPRPASLRSKVLFYEGSKTEAPGAHKKEVFKGKVCSTKDTLTFSQDQKRQIQKASASVIKGVLMEMLKSLSCPPGTPGGSAGKAAAAFSGKPPGLSVQEQLDQLFSVSEVNEVAQDITEAVIDILHAALGRIPDTPESPVPPSGRHTLLDHSHTPDVAREAPHKKPLNIWFDSETKMKYLSSLDLGPDTASSPGSQAWEPQPVDDISGDIVDTVFKKLKGLVYPKLQVSATPPCVEPSSLHRQLSAYAAKVVGIVLQAIQDELELGQKSPPGAADDDGKPLGGGEPPADVDDVDSLVSDLGKDFVASPLLSCICEMLSSAHSDRSSVSLLPEEPGPSVSCGPDGIGQPPRLPSRQEKQAFCRSLATPCAIHSEPDGTDCKDGGKLQVLDSIGETLLDMLCHLLGADPEGPPPGAQPPREKTSESQGTALKLSPHLQHLSRTILDSILAKLCQIDADTGCAASGATVASESLDIDSPSFKSIIEEMAKCTDIISGILSRMLGDSSREEADGKATAVAPGPCRTGSTQETHPNRLTAMAADILNMVFAKLEGFASGSLGALDPVREGQGRKASAEGELPGGGAGEAVDTCEELLLSALYAHAKRASSTILKAIQSELGGSPGDRQASAKSPSPERQLLKNVINLIIDVVSSDVLADDAESQERAMESCGYRPTYGNFLPGGAEPDPCLEDAEKEFGAEGTLPREEMQPGSLKQWVLVRTLNKIEGKLKEPQKSPIVPIIRNILNEIFQGALANQLNVRSLSRSPLRGAPHDVEGELPASASVPFIDQKTGPLVSEADVTVVVGDVVTTVLHKLYTAAMTQRGAGESRYKTITFSANVSFHVPARAEQSSVAMLDGDPCPVPPSLTARGNVAEDIIQEILTNLETFATYKVRSLFCPQIQFTVPMPFPAPPDKSILSKALSAKGLYPDDGFPPYATDHVLEKASGCQLSLNKLNSHATEVARKILQGIKHELDKERESPFLAHSFVVSEGIASQIVNTVLGIVSCRGKCDKPDSEEELPAGLRGGIIERLFNRTEYRKDLQLQIQDIMESILCDIYEKTLHQNNLAVPAPVPRGLRAGQHPTATAADIGLSVEGANTVVPQLSVPKSDVMLMSNNIVDLVLHNLNSAVMLGVRPERVPPPPPPARLPLPFCDVFPQAECRLPPLMGPQSDGNAECFPSSENGRATCADVASQIAVVQRDGPSKPTPDPCEENAHFITTTIVNQLESFATKSIDSLITLPLQPTEESLVSPGLEPGELEDGLFRDPSQRASAGNVLKLPAETVLRHELASPAFASYRQTRGPPLRLPHASLQEYADVIASVILKLIKNDLDLEIQRAHLYPNNISFQENIAVSEIVDNTLRVLNAKRSVREIQFYAKDRPGAFAPLAGPDQALLGQRERDGSATLPLFSQFPLEQRRVERESQRAVLEDIFMRGGESKQREKDALLAPVKEALRKVYQQVIKVKGHLPPFNETPFAAVSTSKTKTSDVTPKTVVQSHITSAANDIVESVLGEMYAVVVTSLHGSPPKEAFEGHGAFPTPPSCVGEAGQAGGGSDSTGILVPQAYPSPGDQNTALLDGGLQQPSPLQVGKDLVQMVLDKITHFAAILKVTPKGSLQQSFKTSLKVKSKVTSLPNLKTKPLLGPAGAKAKGKAKAGPGERIPKGSQSKTCLGLPHMLTAGDAKGPRGARLSAADLRAHAARVTSAILEITVTEFEKAKQSRAMVSVKALPLDQILAASRLVRAVLQGVYAPGAHGLAPPGAFSALAQGDLTPSPGHMRLGGFAETRACFYLENVSSQLEQIFPKDGIFKKMFDKWQAEANDTESEKCNLLVVAENVLTVISMKSKELEYSLSLLNLTHPQAWESGLHGLGKGASVRAEATKAQINMFAREIVEMLLEKLQLCFLSQMATPGGKEAPGSRREHAAQSKLGFPAKHALGSGGVPFYCVDPKDPAWLGSAKQMVLDMVERVLGMLESFVDLQFKHTCKYEFSEMVKMPVENLFPAQQRLLSKNMLPKPQSLRRLADDARSNSIISKENAQNVFLQVHAFHSELLTCAVSITRDMLGVIKSKLDGEIGQAEPPGGGLHENVAASEIIGALMDQCTHVSESLITNLPSLFPEVENTYIVNHLALATDMKVPKAKEVHFGSASPQVSVPGLAFYPEDGVRERCRAPPSVPPYARGPGKGPGRSPGPVGRPDSANAPTSSRNKVPGCGPQEWPFNQAVLGAGSLPEGSILQKLSKRVTESTEEALKQGLSFLEMGKAKNPKVFHYGTPKPAGAPDQTQTTVSPLKICLAAENIVNTVLSSYGFPGQPPVSERTETIKPFFMSAPSPGGHGGDKKSVLTMWGHRASCIPRGGSRNPEASREDFSLLQKWEVKSDPKVRTVKEFEVIAFADHELGPNEINLVARHVTTCVVTYFQNFKSRVSSEMMAIISALSRKTYASEQRLRSIYDDSSLCQLCEHLTESVICHLISSISDGIQCGREREKAWESQTSGYNKIISINSQVFGNRSISIGDLALNISEIITKILFNSNIIEPDIAQQMFSSPKKYIYCPGVTATDFDHLFQDLLIGVIHVLSKVIGVTHHLEGNGRSKPVSMLRSNSVSMCNKTNTMKRQISCRNLESSTHQNEHLIQKDKLNYLAYKLDRIVSSLKTHESKEVVNKVFNIVLDLFLPDERRGEPMDSYEKARKSLSSSSNNVGLTPKSVFLLNIVCEKLIRTLLEKCTNTVFLDDGPPSDGISAEECQLFKMLQGVEDEDLGDCKGATGCEQLQGDSTSDLLENLAEMDPDVLSSDSMLTLISHSLVKSLMDKLCQNIQLPHSTPGTSKHLEGRTQERQLGFTKAKRPGFTGFRQGKGSAGHTSCDGHALTGPLNLSSMVHPKTQSPFGRKCSASASSASPRRRQETAIHNKLRLGSGCTSIYSATFLEEIISELFFNLSTSLWGGNESISEARLCEMNTLLVNNVVREFDRAQVAVLRSVEERLYFPPVQKALVRRVVDSVYPDVLQKYQLKVTCGVNLAHDYTSLAGQITNGILLEVLDYQLPPCFRENLSPGSPCPLEADSILRKLRGSLREFACRSRSSGSYSTRVPHSFLEDTTRRLLAQLTAPPSRASSALGRKECVSSDFSEMSNCIINKVLSAISKHKIWFTICDNPQLCAGKNTQKMADAVYRNLTQMSDSLVAIQNGLVSQSPGMVDRIASFIIQEIVENHLQPFLCEEGLSRPTTPLDAISNMVKQVLSEVTESHRPTRPLPAGAHPGTFIGEIVAKLLAKIFSSKQNTDTELENLAQKIVSSISTQFDKATTHMLCGSREGTGPSVGTDMVDELVSSIYKNVLQQHGLDPEVDTESKDGETFVENVTNLTVATISDYLLHPLFSGDLSSSRSISTAENVVSNASKPSTPSPSLSPYNTLLPYTFLEDMIRVLLSRIFSTPSDFVPSTETLKDRPQVNFNEIASNIISDIRMKISQHDIQCSKDEEEAKLVYSEDDVQHLVDNVFENILQNSESQESVEQNIKSSNNVLIDRIAGFIIKHICQQHLQPFVERKALPSPTDTLPARRPWPSENVYSAAFLEDVIFGVLRKIFHRVLGIVQTKPAKDSEDELLDKARKLIYLIAEELSRAQVRILEDAEDQCCLPPVESDILQSIVDMVFSKVLQEYEMDILPDYDFLNDTKTLAARVTKSILAHTFDFQIHPKLVGKLHFKSYTTLNVDVLIKKVHGYITKSRFQRQASTIYTTMLSHTHLEKVVAQLVSQVGPLAASAEGRGTSKSQLSDSVLKLINEIMSIISKHAICIVKHGGQKQSMMSERDIQSMVDSIYAELSRSKLYQSLTKDKKGISKMPVSKIASFIIKEIFNHHLQSFLPGDKTCLPAVVDLENKQIAADARQGSLALVVNSAAFLEEVIAELLCKLLYAFSHNVLAAEEPDIMKGKITDIVTTLVKSIVLEFTTSEIVVSNYLDNDMCSSARYKEMVQKTANLIYEKILGEYKSLIQVYKVMQRDTTSFGRKIYHLLLEEIYDQQVQSLVSGELVSSSCASLQTDNIIRNVLNVIAKASPAAPCMTVLPRSLLENIVSKLVGSIFPPAHRAREPREEGASPDDDGFLAAASKLTDDIIKEITEHEVRLATAEENAESTPLDVIENLVNSICNNIVKKPEFQAEVKKDADKKAGSFLSKAAGFIMKEIMDHHLRPFLQGDGGSALTKPGKEKTQTSLYSATFLEDVVVDLVRKFYSLLSITEEPKEKGAPETDLVGLAVKFANSLIGEFRKSEVKVLPKAEEVFAFPPVDKETVDKISNFVYDQFIGKYDSDDIQKDEEGHELIETIAGLAQKAISAFKIQPLFSGDWSSTFFSFLNPEPITQRVQHLPQKTAAPCSTGPKGNQLAFSVQSYKYTSPPSGRKQAPGTSEPDRGTANRKRSLPSEEMPVRKGESPDQKVASLTRTMKCNLVSLLLGSPAGVATKKKENEKKAQVSIKSYTEDAATITSPTISVKSKESEKSDLKGAQKNNEPEKKSKSVSTGEEKQHAEVYTQTPGAAVATEWKEKTVGPGLNQRGMDTLRKEYEPYLFPVQLNTADASTTTEGLVTPKLTFVDRKGSRPLVDINKQVADYECVQSITENIYDNILETYFAPESEQSHAQHPPGDKVQVPQEAHKDFAKSVSVRDLSLSGGKDLLAPEQEEEEYNKGAREKEKKQGGGKEKVEAKETKNEPRKPDSAQNPPKSKPGIFPAKLLEDVIIEMVNKLILGVLPKAQTAGRGQSAGGGRHQADLHDTAMQLLDSMLKELSKAQIKVFRPERESPLAPPGSRGPPAPKGPPEQKEPRAAASASPPAKRASAAGKTSQVHKVMKKFPLEVLSFLDRIPAVDKSLVNKVVHSSVCSILKEFKSPDSLRQTIKSNGGNIAKRLTSAMIREAFQHQLNLEPSDRVPAAACLPLERKDVVRKVQKAVRTASKECQTSSPYTILLPHEFLHNVISALLHKIFSIAPKTTADATPEGGWLTELDFLQVKLLGIVMAEISKDEDMTIRYVESLHPNDEEVTQLVALSIYENLRSQFGSQETIRKCVASGCRILSESIVELVLREVSGNQLQSYFSGELTPCQCAEVDSIIENILKDVLRSTDMPQPPPTPARRLHYNVMEEIAIQFLCKLLSVFPKVDKKRNKSLETEMQNIMSKILTSLQEFISKSKIKLIPPAKELPTVPLADNKTIEKVVNSVYSRVLKHSGSHTSIFKDLMGKSNVLSDIIGFLMVKEISNSKFQPQGEEEVSSSELVLEAVKIMEKVVKIVDEFKPQDKSSSKKGSTLDATCLEEALALFLAKLVKLPSASSKDAKNLSKSELNKIASQLTKSVTAEISKSNISLVAADSEGQVLHPKSIEMISQVIDSIYSNVLIQSGSYKDLYYDIRGTNRVFPKKVADLIVHSVTEVSLGTDTDRSQNPNADPFGDLDVNRIVQKAQEHASNMSPDLKNESPEQVSSGEDMPIKIVPHIGNKPLKIDPTILSEHLAVISVKTLPLEKLQVECLRNTGHSIAEVRRASVQGKCHFTADTTNGEKIKKERRTSLTRSGRLDVKPLEPVGRNSFQNVRKPDISKVELLKDVQGKQDLLIRLVAHDIEAKSEKYVGEEAATDDYEFVLRKDIREEKGEQLFDDKAKGADTESPELTWKPPGGPNGRAIKLDRSTNSTIIAVTESCWGIEPQCEKEEPEPGEPIHHLIHRIMSTSSYNQEDLGLPASETKASAPDTPANAPGTPDNSPGTPAKAPEGAPRPSASKQGSGVLARVTSALSKVFSRSSSSSSSASKAAAPAQR
ncbi:fibrous sheath-interacting protein 2 [Pipistrellus kuhlii]|uniref:fibrous sheath-interacting protein 2 n=1 Tax=Pipistrellus kuhlii TaxID=59472 RepID=UPI00174F120B|nr:fibrous sheath-interacting protein 2 [Pipistrellus kuhlii]